MRKKNKFRLLTLVSIRISAIFFRCSSFFFFSLFYTPTRIAHMHYNISLRATSRLRPHLWLLGGTFFYERSINRWVEITPPGSTQQISDKSIYVWAKHNNCLTPYFQMPDIIFRHSMWIIILSIIIIVIIPGTTNRCRYLPQARFELCS